MECHIGFIWGGSLKLEQELLNDILTHFLPKLPPVTHWAWDTCCEPKCFLWKGDSGPTCWKPVHQTNQWAARIPSTVHSSTGSWYVMESMTCLSLAVRQANSTALNNPPHTHTHQHSNAYWHAWESETLSVGLKQKWKYNRDQTPAHIRSCGIYFHFWLRKLLWGNETEENEDIHPASLQALRRFCCWIEMIDTSLHVSHCLSHY